LIDLLNYLFIYLFIDQFVDVCVQCIADNLHSIRHCT